MKVLARHHNHDLTGVNHATIFQSYVTLEQGHVLNLAISKQRKHMKNNNISTRRSVDSDPTSSSELDNNQENPGTNNEKNHFLILKSVDNDDLGTAIRNWESSRYVI